MNARQPTVGLFVTGNLLVAWTLGYVALFLASALPGAGDVANLAIGLFFPWLIGVIVLGVLYMVQR